MSTGTGLIDRPIMRYGNEHRPLEPAEPSEPVETYVDQRELGLEHVVPPQERMAEHQELLSG